MVSLPQDSPAAPPPFEGPEKKLHVFFAPAPAGSTENLMPLDPQPLTRPTLNLRSLPRSDIDAFLTEAACTVLNLITSAHCDAYLLSESSLFVFADRIMIKTCGTTRLLSAIPTLLRLARSVGLELEGIHFSRCAFLFPEAQPCPHNNFVSEVRFLDDIVAPYGGSGMAFQVGSQSSQAWHLYVADLRRVDTDRDHQLIPVTDDHLKQTIEIQMFDLDPTVMAQFYAKCTPAACNSNDSVGDTEMHDQRRASGAETTRRTGIFNLFQGNTNVDPYDFMPCGYSMNGLFESEASTAYYTIHITPEPEASYVSFETSLNTSALTPLIANVVNLFKPNRFCAAFVGSPGSPALQSSSRGPVAWEKLQKLLAHSFSQVGDATVLNAGPNFIISVASYSTSSSELKSLSSQACLSENADLLEFSPRSLQAGSMPPAGDSRVIPFQSPVKQSCDSPMSMSTVDSSDSFPPCDLSGGMQVNDSGKYAIDRVSEDRVADIVGETTYPLERPLFVIDLTMIERRVETARRKIGPQIGIRYAVRCNADAAVLSVMANMGVEFEAASKVEVAALRAAGVSNRNIAFASPMVTWRTVEELGNIRSVAVYAGNVCKLLLKNLATLGIAVEVRVTPGCAADGISACNKAVEQGCRLDGLGLALTPDARYLSAEKFYALQTECVVTLRQVYTGIHPDLARSLSVAFGENFPGTSRSLDDLLSGSELTKLSGLFGNVTVDAGRYIVGPAVTLVTTVIGRRQRTKGDMSCTDAYNYYLNDGYYGSFGGVLLEKKGAKLSEPIVFRRNVDKASVTCGVTPEHAKHEGIIFGPTCDAIDLIWTGPLPRMEVGDAVGFSRMGSYSSSATSTFNGFSRHFDTRYIFTKTCTLSD